MLQNPSGELERLSHTKSTHGNQIWGELHLVPHTSSSPSCRIYFQHSPSIHSTATLSKAAGLGLSSLSQRSRASSYPCLSTLPLSFCSSAHWRQASCVQAILASGKVPCLRSSWPFFSPNAFSSQLPTFEGLPKFCLRPKHHYPLCFLGSPF